MSLPALLAEVRAFAHGSISIKALQHWWLPYLIANPPERPEEDEPDPWTPEEDEHALFWQIIWLLETDADEEQHRKHARRLLTCVDQTGSATTTLDLLALIVDQDRFCGIVTKHQNGLVSVTGLRSVISKSRYEPPVKEWLAAASPDAVVALGEKLCADNYWAVADLISRPPA